MLSAVIATFVGALGLCVGSFLNVVLYRLPAGLSVARPARSFCPACRVPIAWYDNLPVLSWLLLRGRCRQCRCAIGVRYPLVEAVTGLVFVLVYALLFAERSRVGLATPAWPGDVPLLATWLVLAAVLVACAAMDLNSYMVDTRITDVALIAGLVLHAAWPRPEFVGPIGGDAIGAAALAALLLSGVMLWWSCAPAPGEIQPDASSAPSDSTPASSDAPAATGHAVGILGVATCLIISVALIAASAQADASPGPESLAALAAPAALLALFLIAVLVSGQRRAADELLSAAIEEEQPIARRTALRELLWLTPIILVGVVVWLAVDGLPLLASGWKQATQWSPLGGMHPLAGLAFAAHGAIVGAAAGWMLRIVFTLAFGREALGTGDIFILAAAGAAAGWDIALLGLLLAVGLAMAGWLLTMLLKSSVLLSFGPWLALGFVAALWLNRPAAETARFYVTSIRVTWQEQPAMLAVGGGLMLIGTAFSVVLARLARRLAERAAKAE